MGDFLEPFRRRQALLGHLEGQLRETQAERMSWEKAIAEYRAFDPPAVRNRIGALNGTVSAVSDGLKDFGDAHSRLEEMQRSIRAKQVSVLQFWAYFGSDQAQLRQDDHNLSIELASVEGRTKVLRTRLAELIAEREDAQKSIADHEAFDLTATLDRLSQVNDAETRIIPELSVARTEMARLEDRIGPHLQEHERLKAEMSRMEADIANAECMNRELDSATNSFERREIHLRCEEMFGEGKPSKVIGERSGKLRSLTSNIPKLERRIAEELQKAERVIDHLLIDGNNVCYEDREFIKMQALKALLVELHGRFRVTVVFDATICPLMKTDKQGIEQILGPGVSVHVVPAKTSADGYLLKMAGTNPRSFIFSNDRYSEYHDYDAVRSGRVLRFMIADGLLMANDLDITVRF